MVGSRGLVPLLLLASSIAVTVGCNGHTNAGAREPVSNVPDVEARNLSPDDEIDALMKGKPSIGRSKSATRIAVPPFQLRARPDVVKEREYLGSSVAELLASRIAHTTGVSVLERGELTKIIEELKRAGGDGNVDAQAARQIAGKGRLAGAQLLLVGSIIERDASRFHAVVKPVRVEDAVILPTVEFDLDAKSPDEPLDDVAAKVLDKIGLNAEKGGGGPKTAAHEPLSADAVAMATRARELQYQGRLVEAQPLYAKSLAQPSDNWKLEGDYVRLMIDLGMYDWALARTSDVLARMPTDASSVCDRASLTTQRARAIEILDGAEAIGDAREAVRLAASCADPVQIGSALMVYGNAIGRVHFPTSMRAFERAAELAEKGKSAWLSCWAVGNRLVNRIDSEGDWGGERAQQYEKQATACEAAGNLRIAATHMGNAAVTTWLPRDRAKYHDAAVALGRRVGGATLDDRLFASADNLRSSGKPSEADALLLDVIGSHLREIIALTKVVIEPEIRIDDDLFRRAKVEKPKGSPQALDEATKLVLVAHRKALAQALRRWADRTRAESRQQGEFYGAVADALDPPKEAKLEDRDQRITHTLEKAKLPMAKILEMTDAPLRSSAANPTSAFWALDEQYWAFVDTAPDRARDIAAAMRKLATWTEHPGQLRRVALYEAKIHLKKDNAGAALERLGAARAYAKDDPGFYDWVFDFESEAAERQGHAKVSEVRAQQLEVAKRVSPDRLVWATYNAENAAFVANTRSFNDGAKKLLQVSDEMVENGAIETAALAIERATRLLRDGMHVDGSPLEVDLYARRTKLLDRLDDRLRSLDARIDQLNAVRDMLNHTYRGGTTKVFKTHPDALRLMEDIRTRLDQLVVDGKLREATRATSRLRSDAPGTVEITRKALGWSESFKDSAEYPRLAGLLHQQLANEATDEAEKKREFSLARDLFVKASSNGEATWAQHQVMSLAQNETELWALADGCWTIAADNAIDKMDCAVGISFFLKASDAGAHPLEHRDRLKEVVKRALDALPAYDRAQSPTERARARTHIGKLAAHTGDVPTFDRMLGDIRTYYTKTQPDAYQFVSYQSTFAESARAFDLKRSIALWKEFEAARGASAYWRSGEYAAVAKTARIAGDSASEKFFLETGRRAAEEGYRENVYRYDLYDARILSGSKDWRGSAKAYAKTRATIDAVSPRFYVARAVTIVDEAVALVLAKDPAAAARALKPHLAAWEEDMKSGMRVRAPCTATRAFEVGAAIDMKTGACATGKKKREIAEELRRMCVPDNNDGTWTEDVGYASVRFDNACNKPADITDKTLID